MSSKPTDQTTRSADANQAALHELADRLLAYVAGGTTATHPDGARRMPVSHYLDPDQFELEKRTILRTAPQLVCFSGDLPEPGSYLTDDYTGVPMLLVRDQDGTVRAYLNACRHRGARLIDGAGCDRRNFVCPYHAWTYGLDGALTNIYKAETFGEIDKKNCGLVELPSEEKYGLIYVSPDPSIPVSIDDHLGELGPQIGGWNLGRATYVDSHVWEMNVNWKVVLDTFCEGYHFAPMHPKTIGALVLTNVMAHDRYGTDNEHHRIAFPLNEIVELKDKPREEWGDLLKYFQLVHFLYPNVVLLISADEVQFFRLFPGDAVGEHTTRYSLYMRQPIDSEDRQKFAHIMFKFIRDVVDQDDYRVAATVQKNLETGHLTHTLIGRNEPSIIDMHRAIRTKLGLEQVDEPAG